MEIKTVNCIIMTTGYVEDASVASLIFTTDDCGGPFADMTPKMAIETLAEDMYAKYVDRQYHEAGRRARKKCCMWHKENTNDKKCSACNRKLTEAPECEEFKTFLCSVLKSDADECGGWDGTVEINNEEPRNLIWSPFYASNIVEHIKNDEFLIVYERGEEILSLALLAKNESLLDTNGDEFHWSFNDDKKDYKKKFLKDLEEAQKYTKGE
jgi:hypothetical protein